MTAARSRSVPAHGPLLHRRDGPDDEALADGVRWLRDYALVHSFRDAAILVAGLRQIDSLGRVIGQDLARRVAKSRSFTLDGVNIQVFTKTTGPRFSFAGPILVPWANTKMVNDAERLAPPAVCAVPWTREDLKDWKSSWAPVDPRTGVAEVAAQVPTAVESGVRSISGLGNDIVHPLDRQRAIDMLKSLRLVEIPIEPTLVRSVAVREGWQPDAADRLQELAEKVASGRAVRGGSPKLTKTRAKELVARWERGED